MTDLIPSADIPREEDRDALADVIWFIKGAQSIDKDFALDHRHIEALRRYRVTNVDQVVEKARRELANRCDRLMETYQAQIDKLNSKLRAKRRGKKVRK